MGGHILYLIITVFIHLKMNFLFLTFEHLYVWDVPYNHGCPESGSDLVVIDCSCENLTTAAHHIIISIELFTLLVVHTLNLTGF